MVGIVALAVACGGGTKTVSASAFAKGFCGTVTDWMDAVEQRSNELESTLGDVQADLGDEPSDERARAAVDEVRRTVVRGLETFRDETGDVVGELDDVGNPDIEGGEQLVDDVQAIFAQAEEAVDGYIDEVDALDTEDPETVVRGFVDVNTEIDRELGSIFGEFAELPDRYPSEQLTAAFDNEPACAPFEG